jgi:hypothetical protein
MAGNPEQDAGANPISRVEVTPGASPRNGEQLVGNEAVNPVIKRLMLTIRSLIAALTRGHQANSTGRMNFQLIFKNSQGLGTS